MRVLYTGGNGKYANQLKITDTYLSIDFPTKEECNLVDRESIDNYTNKNPSYDIVITGANKFPGAISGYDLDSFLIPINHLYLIEKLSKRPKYFIHLTTGLIDYDEHYLYRAQKTYAESLFTRYFTLEKNSKTRFINFHPHHVDDPGVRKKSAIAFISLLENIYNYQELEYSVDIDNSKIQNIKF